MWRSLAAVAVGGAIGPGARYGIDLLVPHETAGTLALSTIIVNVVGSFVLGLLVARWWPHPGVPLWLKAGVGTGILGSFTTFSAVTLNAVAGAVEANLLAAGGALIFSTVLGLLAAWAGLATGGARLRRDAAIPDGGADL